MFKKSILIGIAILIVAGIILCYYYYPFTPTGCDNLRDKIEQQISSATSCNLSSDCSFNYNLGCEFPNQGYFSKNISQGLISRYLRRCRACNEKTYFESANPACLEHACQVTGGAVLIQTDQEEYQNPEEIKLQVTNNLLTEINYNFPITLCLRPTIMRLEKYNEETKEWLSSGVGLLFDNNQVLFYENPSECPSYKIKNCTPETAPDIIDQDTLKINQQTVYTIPTEIIQPCPENTAEVPRALTGRCRIGLYYEPPQGLGKQIYTNEFVIN